MLLAQLERRFGNLFGLKNDPMQMSPTLGNCRQQKSSNERPTKTQHAHLFQDLTHASNLEGLFHTNQNLVEISWCLMDGTLYNAISHWQKEVDVILKDGIFHFGSGI